MSLRLEKDHVLAESELRLTARTKTDPRCDSMSWRIENAGVSDFVGVVRLRVNLPSHFHRPWLMVPGFIYGENRRLDQHAPKLYPRLDPEAQPPREMCSTWWDFAADRTASPLVFAHENGRCFAVASVPHYGVDGEVNSDDPEPQVGVGLGYTDEGVYARVSVPACEEPFTYCNHAANEPTIRRLVLAPGAAVEGTVYVYAFKADRHGYQGVVEDYWRRVGPEHPAAALPELEPLVADALHGIVAAHYLEDRNYFIYSRSYDPVLEQIANSRGVTLQWHQMMTGFVGGFMVCRSLLDGARLVGDAAARRVAVRVAERICREGVSPSGLFWADYVPREIRTPNGVFPNPLFLEGRNEWGSGWLSGTTRVHSRTIADACDHLAAMIVGESDCAETAESCALWRGALVGNLEAALDLQQDDGSYGQYYDAIERAVVKEDGCGGLLWIPAMIKAIRLGLGGADLVGRMEASVRRAGEGYAPYVLAETIWGAPEDNDSPTSEDGMNAVMAYTDLYEHTDDRRWLDLAVVAADWMLTFRKTYNQILPPDSLMGRYGMRSKGGDFASASNNHLHVFEALCTRHLCNLSRWTDRDYYRERAREHWTFVTQHLSRCDGMFNGFRGAMGEQFYWTNYGSWGRWIPPAHHRQKGNMAPMAALWCAAVIPIAAIAAAENFNL